MTRGTATALLGVAAVVMLTAAAPAAAEPSVSWSVDLAEGEVAAVMLDADGARLAPRAFVAARGEGHTPTAAPQPTGLLTFPSRRLDHVTDGIVAVVDAEVPDGATVTVDVRARRGTGGWTEWLPAVPAGGELRVGLPARSSEVQGRLVLTGGPATTPLVRAVTLTARPAAPGPEDEGEDDDDARPLVSRVFATREGLVGSTTANGHVIAERDHFVALPSRRALAPRDTSDYAVRVCASTGRCTFAPVWDVGPWNTRDDYWNSADERENWDDLPQGLPQAQAAHLDGYNDGRDQYDRTVANPAGIDLSDGLFWDGLGLTDNAWVDVEYLWTGSARLTTVVSTAEIRAAPDADAEVIGLAADRAAVPVECVVDSGDDRWLQVGTGLYLAAAAVTDLAAVRECVSSPATEPESPASDDTAAG